MASASESDGEYGLYEISDGENNDNGNNRGDNMRMSMPLISSPMNDAIAIRDSKWCTPSFECFYYILVVVVTISLAFGVMTSAGGDDSSSSSDDDGGGGDNVISNPPTPFPTTSGSPTISPTSPLYYCGFNRQEAMECITPCPDNDATFCQDTEECFAIPNACEDNYEFNTNNENNKNSMITNEVDDINSEALSSPLDYLSSYSSTTQYWCGSTAENAALCQMPCPNGDISYCSENELCYGGIHGCDDNIQQ